ncbi:MAG: hypothetical protein JWP25_5762 [Bradyrhizobium sp.]|jgi:sugar lactone lactonase YvrE|nr:hypothetical protein [Bradyrhizobium sp.]
MAFRLLRHRRLFASGLGLILWLLCCEMTALAASTEISIPGDHTFPESLTSTADGTVYIGSMAEGVIFRVPPGESKAEAWIKPGSNGLLSVLGVLADERSGTLWACSSDLSAMGVVMSSGAKPVALKGFDLKTGAPKGSFALPGDHSLCNDMVVGSDGAVFITDSFNPHILRLKPGSEKLEIWAEDPRLGVANGAAGLDGIAIGGDGNVYTNTFNGGGLFRVEMKKDGSAGSVTPLQTSRPLVLPDGLRKLGDNTFLMIEGEGRLDLVTIDGENAKLEVVKDGYKGPVAVTQIGQMAWVLEGQLTHLFEPKTGKPDPFLATSVPIPPH